MAETLDRASSRGVLTVATIATLVATAIGLAQTPKAGQSDGLRIVVLEGEAAVNIVRQKTAVVPLVEVRDRNDQPVAGAVVTFAVRNGRAVFSGARTLTVTTNAAGRAAATGLTPTGSGAVQIGASVTFQGQTAAVTIAQTNVMTAAEAAAVSSAGASGSGAGGIGAAAGGGTAGGLSATTIAVVAGAAAGGTLVAKELQGSDAPRSRSFAGDFSGTMLLGGTNAATNSPTCTFTETYSGTLELDLTLTSDGAVSGSATLKGTKPVVVGTTCVIPDSRLTSELSSTSFIGGPTEVTGTMRSLGFNKSQSFTIPAGGIYGPLFTGATVVEVFTFSGALSAEVITGTFAYKTTLNQNNGPAGQVAGGRQGEVSVPVTLR